MRNHNVHGTVCQRREAAAVAPQSEFLRELHRRWTSSGLLREIDVALAHLDDFADDAAIEDAMGRVHLPAGPAASEDARLGLKLAKLLTKRRRNALLLDETPRPAVLLDETPRPAVLLDETPRPAGQWSASSLWAEIMARTDEMYELAELYKDRFDQLLRLLYARIGQRTDLEFHVSRWDPKMKREERTRLTSLMTCALKDPIRVHEKALDDYQGRFADGAPPEACVVDLVRARAILSDASRFQQLCDELEKGVREELNGEVLTLRLVRGKNKFRTLDPSHFRNILLNLLLLITTRDGKTMRLLCEVELNHIFVLQYNMVAHAHEHYDFFRSHLKDYENELAVSIDFMLETRIRVFEEVSALG